MTNATQTDRTCRCGDERDVLQTADETQSKLLHCETCDEFVLAVHTPDNIKGEIPLLNYGRRFAHHVADQLESEATFRDTGIAPPSSEPEEPSSQMAEELVSDLAEGLWPSAAKIVDFAIDSTKHYGVLKYLHRGCGVSSFEFDKVLGDGAAITDLARLHMPANLFTPDSHVTFKTAYDNLLPEPELAPEPTPVPENNELTSELKAFGLTMRFTWHEKSWEAVQGFPDEITLARNDDEPFITNDEPFYITKSEILEDLTEQLPDLEGHRQETSFRRPRPFESDVGLTSNLEDVLTAFSSSIYDHWQTATPQERLRNVLQPFEDLVAKGQARHALTLQVTIDPIPPEGVYDSERGTITIAAELLTEPDVRAALLPLFIQQFVACIDQDAPERLLSDMDALRKEAIRYAAHRIDAVEITPEQARSIIKNDNGLEM